MQDITSVLNHALTNKAGEKRDSRVRDILRLAGWLRRRSGAQSPTLGDPAAGSMPGLPALHRSLRRWITGNCLSPFTLFSSTRAGQECLAVGKAGQRAERQHQEGFPLIARPHSENHSFGWLFLRRTPARTPARLPAAFPRTPSGRPSSDPV